MSLQNGRNRSALAIIVHFLRVGLLFGLVAAIPPPSSPMHTAASSTPPWDELDDFLPEGDFTFSDQADARGMWRVSNQSGQNRGWVVRTFPAAQEVRGYNGPTEAILWLNEDLEIQRVVLLQSADTTEHVDAVRADREFLGQFRGWSWTEAPDASKVDAVSGATLTSLALAEGLLCRMGGERTSLLFADPVTVDEVSNWFPDAERVITEGALSRIIDANDNSIGQVLRTGPLADDVIGYQGASELLIKLDTAGRVSDIRLRSSQDNLPYTDYVQDEAYFWRSFLDVPLERLAGMDLEQEGIEGVSGATMTSLAVAEVLVKAAAAKVAEDKAKESQNRTLWQQVRYGWSDIATWLLLVIGLLFHRLGWWGHRRARSVWLCVVILTIGLWTGNLLSLSLLAGWSTGGIAWRLAPGLATLAILAIVLPPLRKTNPYCNHVCPHGAIQQLLRPGRESKRKRSLGRQGHAWLRWLPGATLVTAYVALLVFPQVNLADWEPFHAYLFRIAGWTSIAFAIGTLLMSAFIPMGYCRYGCPTGSLLDYLRRTSRSHRLSLGDGFAALLLLFAWVIRS